MKPVLRVMVLAHGRDLPRPDYQTEGAAGMDLVSAASLVLEPGARAAVPTGLIVVIPEGHEGQVRPRSGLALKHGITVVNAPGTIDSDYRGELQVLLINLGNEAVTLTRGMRVAQLVIAPVTRVAVEEVEGLDDTARGAGGFGSTGV